MKLLLIITAIGLTYVCKGQHYKVGDTVRCQQLKGDSNFFKHVIRGVKRLQEGLWNMHEQRIVQRIDANSLDAAKHVNPDGTVWFDLLNRFELRETPDSVNLITRELRGDCGRFENYLEAFFDMYFYLWRDGYYVVSDKFIFYRELFKP